MDFYESSVQRFVFATGPNKTYLAKNVMSTGRFKSLLQRFPDARFIYISRHPYQALPSFVSMCSSMYRWHSPEISDNSPAKKAWAQLGIDFYKYSREMKTTIPDNQFVELKYDDLLRDPKGEVLKIYQHFGWTASEKFLEKLEAEKLSNRNYHSSHEYSLEQFGLQKELIYQELAETMDELGFSKDC